VVPSIATVESDFSRIKMEKNEFKSALAAVLSKAMHSSTKE
jgi:hypothetical protein